MCNKSTQAVSDNPEIQLYAAMLQQAVQDLKIYQRSKQKNKQWQRESMQLIIWWENTSNYPLSINWLCDILDTNKHNILRHVEHPIKDLKTLVQKSIKEDNERRSHHTQAN